MKNIIITLLGMITVIAGLVVATRSGVLGDKVTTGTIANTAVSTATGGADSILTAPEKFFDFGKISMSAGDVEYVFKIRNEGASPVNLAKLYTSCMCTTAYLKIGEYDRGPFGMPGHGIVPKVNKELLPNQEAEIRVVFDPAAHGPSGIGKIERVVYLESSSGTVEFGFTAEVTP
ncbi:MAG: DUF1573 domain-containing protein [Minisyncoccia bacterium]